MDTFKIIYKVLRYLERCIGQSERDVTPLTGEALHVEQEKLDEILSMVVKEGYVDGVEVRCFIHSRVPTILGLDQAKITLKGMEYLQENSVMKKATDIAKGLADFVPGL